MKQPIFVSLSLFISISIAGAQAFNTANKIAGEFPDKTEHPARIHRTGKESAFAGSFKTRKSGRGTLSRAKKLLRLRDNNDMGLNQLRTLVKWLKDQNQYTARLLDEFVRTFEMRIHVSETQLYAKVAEEARRKAADRIIDAVGRVLRHLRCSLS